MNTYNELLLESNVAEAAWYAALATKEALLVSYADSLRVAYIDIDDAYEVYSRAWLSAEDAFGEQQEMKG